MSWVTKGLRNQDAAKKRGATEALKAVSWAQQGQESGYCCISVGSQRWASLAC